MNLTRRGGCDGTRYSHFRRRYCGRVHWRIAWSWIFCALGEMVEQIMIDIVYLVIYAIAISLGIGVGYLLGIRRNWNKRP